MSDTSDTKRLYWSALMALPIAATILAATCGLAPAHPTAANIFVARKGIALLEFVGTERLRGSAMPSFGYTSGAAFCDPERIRYLHQAGIQFVRLVVNPFPLMGAHDELRASAIDKIMACVDMLLLQDVAAIVDVHFWSPRVTESQTAVLTDPKQFGQLRKGLVELAQDLKRRRQDAVALEPLNEPPCKLNGLDYDWDNVQRGLIRQLREVAPTLPLLVTGCSGSLDEMLKLKQSLYLSDGRIIFSFHFYEPFIFTHQYVWGGAKIDNIAYPPPPNGREGAISDALVKIAAAGLPAAKAARIETDVRRYLNSNYGLAEIAHRLDLVGDWARKHGVQRSRIFVGEFAAAIGMPKAAASEQSRASELRWIFDVRAAIERSGFSYAYWYFPRPNDYAYDNTTRFLKLKYLNALGLREPR